MRARDQSLASESRCRRWQCPAAPAAGGRCGLQSDSDAAADHEACYDGTQAASDSELLPQLHDVRVSIPELKMSTTVTNSL